MQVIFIDEISMVGSAMFNFLDLLLQQIMGSYKGTIWRSYNNYRWRLISTETRFDNWIFENLKDGYAALATNLWQKYFQVFELNPKMLLSLLRAT
jgi:hypothetical protein